MTVTLVKAYRVVSPVVAARDALPAFEALEEILIARVPNQVAWGGDVVAAAARSGSKDILLQILSRTVGVKWDRIFTAALDCGHAYILRFRVGSEGYLDNDARPVAIDK